MWSSGVSLRVRHWADWSAMRLILPASGDNLGDIFLLIKLRSNSFAHLRKPVTRLPAENVNEIPPLHCALYLHMAVLICLTRCWTLAEELSICYYSDVRGPLWLPIIFWTKIFWNRLTFKKHLDKNLPTEQWFPATQMCLYSKSVALLSSTLF